MGTVTVLFTDLVDSTALRVAVGERAADRLREAHDGLLCDVVVHHDGAMVKGTGDGIIATFLGAADAVTAAIGIQQAVYGWDADGVGRQSIRVGLSAGDVTWDGGDCFGTPVIEAARLCAAADGGQILAADVVRVLARGRHGSDLIPLGALELKGLPEPVTAYEVSWAPLPGEQAEDRVPLPAALRPDREFAFSGRAKDLSRLTDTWSLARRGERRLMLIAGEPGIGKTRLAGELAELAHADGATVLYGRCDEDMGFSYQPFIEALQYFIHHRDADSLVTELGTHGGDLVRLCPDLTSIVTGLPPPLCSDPEVERHRLFDAVAGWLRAATQAGPMVLVLDDLHGAAKPALLLLRHVLRETDGCRLLFVVTYRDTEVGRTGPFAETLAELRAMAGVERLSLVGLDEADVAALLDQPSDCALTRAVYAETEGNPFFAREVVRHLHESGAITKREGRWFTDGSIATLGIPEGVREVVGRRLSRLSAAANESLMLAAVIGSVFTLRVLQAVQAADEDRLVDALDEAIAARLVIEVGVGEYRFSHALVRSTLYDELGLTTRVRLHRRVALALESAGSDDMLALAHHFGLAAASGEAPRAARYTLLAARHALDARAIEDARTLAAATLDVLDIEDDHALRCDALTCLGEAQRLLGEASYRGSLLAAARLAREIGDVRRLVEATLANAGGVADVLGADGERIELLEAALLAIGSGDTTDRARLLAVLANQLGAFIGFASERAFELADEALTMARRVGDPTTLTFVLHMHCDATHVPETLAARLENSNENVALAEEIGDPVALGWALVDQGVARGEMGDVDGLFDCTERRGAIGAEYGIGAFRRAPYLARAWKALHEGRVVEAESLADEAFRFLTETGHPSAFAFYAGQLTAIRRDQGRLDELLPLVFQAAEQNPSVVAFQSALCLIHAELDQPAAARAVLHRLAVDRFAAIPHDFLWLAAMCTCADVSAWLDDHATATVLFEQLSPFSTQFATSVFSLGSVAQFVGALAGTVGRFEDADVYFAQAAAMNTKVGAVICLARTQLDWARMLLARGAPTDAERARVEIDHALSAARTIGLPTLERRALELISG